jgi:hypothetical protein
MFVEEAIFQRLEHVRRCFAGPNPTPSEDVLAARIALCELVVYSHEISASGGSMTIAQAEWEQKKLTMAHNRFNSAILTLAKVRRLAKRPVLAMVNIATNQQLNIGPETPSHDITPMR